MGNDTIPDISSVLRERGTVLDDEIDLEAADTIDTLRSLLGEMDLVRSLGDDNCYRNSDLRERVRRALGRIS